MKTPKQTIIIRSPNWVGDAVVSTAILEPLRCHRPEARLLVAAKQYVAPVFHQHRFLDGVIEFKGFPDGIRAISGESGIILPHSFSSALLFCLAGVRRRIGYRSEFRSFLLTDAIPPPSLKVEHLVENYRRLAVRFLKEDGDDRFEPSLFLSDEERHANPFQALSLPAACKPALLDPGSAYGAAKVWQVEKYAAVVDYLAGERKMPVVLMGGAKAESIAIKIRSASKCEVSMLTGRLTLRQAMTCISKSALFISPDTGGMHVAAAFGIPQVAIFGSSSPVWTRPLNEKSRVVYKQLECSPCFRRECPLNTYACLTSISAEDVITKIEELI